MIHSNFRIRFSLISFIFLISGATQFFGQVDATNYASKTFMGMKAAHRGCVNPTVDWSFCHNLHKYQTKVQYKGNLRQLGKERSDYVTKLAQSWASQPELNKIILSYHQEILIEQAGKQYWIPIQDKLVPEIEKSLKVNDQIIIYVVIPGGIRSQLIFMMTRFDDFNS